MAREINHSHLLDCEITNAHTVCSLCVESVNQWNSNSLDQLWAQFNTILWIWPLLLSSMANEQLHAHSHTRRHINTLHRMDGTHNLCWGAGGGDTEAASWFTWSITLYRSPSLAPRMWGVTRMIFTTSVDPVLFLSHMLRALTHTCVWETCHLLYV